MVGVRVRFPHHLTAGMVNEPELPVLPWAWAGRTTGAPGLGARPGLDMPGSGGYAPPADGGGWLGPGP